MFNLIRKSSLPQHSTFQSHLTNQFGTTKTMSLLKPETRSSSRLRGEKSQLDSRVTLMKIEPEEIKPIPSSSSLSSLSSSSKETITNRTETNQIKPSEIKPSLTKRKRSTKVIFKEPEEEDDEPPSYVTNLNPIKSPRKRTSPKKPIKLSLDIPHSAPQRWEETYNLIKTQRANLIAPVDTMGCDQAGRDPSDGECKVSEAERRLSCLVSLMLSSQTKDQITHEALMNLRSKLSNGLSIQSLRNASLHQIEECIKKVGFWRRKSVYLKQMAEDLFRFHQSDVPNTLEGLVALKGVGPKMAFLALASAWSINEGIGVDTHVHRITNRLGWHSIPTIDPEKTRLNLQSWLPKPLHQEINHLLVGFGQMICLPIRPKCEICLVGTREGLCPSKKLIKDKKRKSKIKKVKEVKEESEEEEGVEIEIEAKVKVEVEVNESGKGMKDVKGKVKFEDEDEDRKVRLSSLGINQEEVHQEEHLISLIKKEDLIDDW